MRRRAFSARTEGSERRELNQENTHLWANTVLTIHLISLIQDFFNGILDETEGLCSENEGFGVKRVESRETTHLWTSSVLFIHIVSRIHIKKKKKPG